MQKSLVELDGKKLTLEEYISDYSALVDTVPEGGSWKLERQQEFIEPGSASWEAFTRGDWVAALEIFDQWRPDLTAYFERFLSKGFEFRRVRVVEEPFTPYLIWELNGLRIRNACGEKIRVVEQRQIESLELDGVLPEIVALGTETVYQVLYGDDGAAEGSILSTNQATVARWIQVTEELYEQGEELESFFARKVAGLVPPNGEDSYAKDIAG